MRDTIDIFTTLGLRLATLGTTPQGEELMAKAIEANPWFTRRDIIHAVEAIRHDMLSEEALSEWLRGYAPTTEPKHDIETVIIVEGCGTARPSERMIKITIKH